VGDGVNLKDWRQDAPQFVENVFDAAMEATKNVTVVHDGRHSVIVTMGEDEWLALYEARRKAEEVERGD